MLSNTEMQAIDGWVTAFTTAAHRMTDVLESVVDVLKKDEQPADDSEPITVEWLRSVAHRFELSDSYAVFASSRFQIYVELFGKDGKPIGPLFCGFVQEIGLRDEDGCNISPLQTRGDLRRLCRCFGIQIKEVQ